MGMHDVRPKVTCDGVTISVTERDEIYRSVYRLGCWWLEFPIRLQKGASNMHSSGNETGDANVPETCAGAFFFRICETDPERVMEQVTELTELSFERMGVAVLEEPFTQYVDEWLEDHAYLWRSEEHAERYEKAAELLIKPFFRREDREVLLRHEEDDINQTENIWGETIREWQRWAERRPGVPDYLVRYALALMRFSLGSLYRDNYYHYDLSRHLRNHSRPAVHHEQKRSVPDGLLRDLFTGGVRSSGLNQSRGRQLRHELIVLYVFALRKSEGPALREENYSAKDHTLKVDAQIRIVKGVPTLVMGTKTGYSQRIVIASGAELLFEEMRKAREAQAAVNAEYSNPDVLLVTQDDGSAVDPDGIAEALRDLTDGRVHPHMLRAQSLTDILEEKRKDPRFTTKDVGHNMMLLKAIARFARHQDPRTTCRYFRSDQAGLELLRDAIAKDRERIAKGENRKESKHDQL